MNETEEEMKTRQGENNIKTTKQKARVIKQTEGGGGRKGGGWRDEKEERK